MSLSKISYLLILPRFDYLPARTVEEACSLLSQYNGKAKVLAGGTDLIPRMKRRKERPQHLIGIKTILGMDYMGYDDTDGLKIGALATLNSIASSSVINDKFKVLSTACRKVGTPQVRNMGTLAGNVCQAGPSQDTVPALLVLEARVKLVSKRGERIVAIDEFFVGPFQSVLKHDELLTEIQVPVPPTRSIGCHKWTNKGTEVDETLVGVAVLIAPDPAGEMCEDVKIGLTSVAPTPMRARRAEEVLRGRKINGKLIEQASEIAAEETMPRSRPDYRRRMTSVLVKGALTEAWKNLG